MTTLPRLITASAEELLDAAEHLPKPARPDFYAEKLIMLAEHLAVALRATAAERDAYKAAAERLNDASLPPQRKVQLDLAWGSLQELADRRKQMSDAEIDALVQDTLRQMREVSL